jgi:hypothetical protein
MIQPSKKATGFTIIELMLAMGFVGMLLLAIAMTTIQIGKIYNKGITLREVNQAGRSLSDELQRSIASTSPFDVETTTPAEVRYIKQPGGGRLCIGKYSYAWNTGSALAKGMGAPAVVNVYQETDAAPIRFIRVDDPSASLCTNPSNKIVQSDATEMLDSGDRDLVVHRFSIKQTTPPDATTGQALYAISFVLGTNDTTQLDNVGAGGIATNDVSCKPPAQGEGGEDYCSVNSFDIIARAGNKGGQ